MVLPFYKPFSRKRNVHHGGGLLDNTINSLPIEIHLPGYQFCGPGTKLEKRLKRGDSGINPLDAACRVHDISYSKNKNITKRHEADKILAEKAWSRVKASDSSLGEKTAAYFVTNAMKAKTKFGMGIKPNTSCLKKKKFQNAIKEATSTLKKEKPQDIDSAIKIARKIIHKSLGKKKKEVVVPRVISVPKIGGFLPLIPILTALGAIGSLSAGGAAIAKAINNAKTAREQLEENKRHNKSIEAIALGQGLYLKPYRKGYGIVHTQTKN